MITINLLAPGKRRAAGPTPGMLMAVGSIALIVLVFAVVGVVLSTRVASLHRQLNDVNRQIDAVRPIALQVQRLEATLQSLEVRQDALKKLLGTQLPASESLQAIKSVIPTDVWLINVTTQQGGRSVQFDGYTFTYRSVARFMIALKDSDRFRNVDLTATQKDRVGEREVVKFQVTGELTGTPTKTGDLPWPGGSVGQGAAPAGVQGDLRQASAAATIGGHR